MSNMLELMPKEVFNVAHHVAYAAARFIDDSDDDGSLADRWGLMGVYIVIGEGRIKAFAADGHHAASYDTEAPAAISRKDIFKVFVPNHDEAEENTKYYNLIGDFITKGDVLSKSWYSIRGLKESVKNSNVTVPINDVDTPILKLFGLWVKSSFIEDFYNNVPVGEDDLSPVLIEVVANNHSDIQEHLRLQCGLYECAIMPIKLKEDPSG